MLTEKTIIKKIKIDANRENVYSEIEVLPGDIINISAEGGYQRGTYKIWSYRGDKNAKVTADYTFQNADPWSLVGWIGTETDQNNYFQVSKNTSITADKSGFLYFAVNDLKNKYFTNRGGPIVTVTLKRPAGIERNQIEFGSIVNLQNRYSEDAGYLDAWGRVSDKPEFSRLPTEEMFVSTYKNSNRNNGSGS